MTELSLVVHKKISAPIENVYNAWLDPKLLARFMIPGDGMSVPTADVDARVGGRFEIIMLAGDQEIPHSGVYKHLNPHSQIVFSWESEMSVEGSTVTLNFTESNGITTVELVHIKFSDQDACEKHTLGWTSILSNLDKTISKKTVSN